jgi:aminopeptidase
MRDIRIDRWAHTLVHYSLAVKPGDLVAIQATPIAEPLIEAVYREILHAGGEPLPLIELEHLNEILLYEGNDTQLSTPSPVMHLLAEQANARLTIKSSSNTKALSGIDPTRAAKRFQATNQFRDLFHKREEEGSFRWCLTLYPTTGYAQDSSMSLSTFEEFVFDVCFLNDPDPIARWRELGTQQQRLVNWLAGRKRVHIVGAGTDLTLSIEKRIFINSDGKRNFPSGEFFTSPIENSANGVIQFDIPSTYDGHAVAGIRLVFRAGKVVEASAQQGQEYLLQMLALDAGARYLGEFAFGNNMRINRTTQNILFDEKMGGTIHLALGASYPETGGMNRSTLHWDMICDLRKSGEVWVDDILFLKDGKILV